VLGSRPWLFLLFFLLGFAAGVLNVVRSYERMQREFAARGGEIGRSVPDDE
jgi:F0F1-type ATP synthase assembly protein I